MFILNCLGYLLLSYLCIAVAMGPVSGVNRSFFGHVFYILGNLSLRFWLLFALSVLLISLR